MILHLALLVIDASLFAALLQINGPGVVVNLISKWENHK